MRFSSFHGNKKAQSAFKTINMFWNAFCAHERKQLDAYRSGSGFDQSDRSQGRNRAGVTPTT